MDLLGMFLFAAIMGSMILVPLAYALLKSDRPVKRERPRLQPPPVPTYWKEMSLYREGEELLDLYRPRKKKS